MFPTGAAIVLIGITMLALWGWRDAFLQERQGRSKILESVADTLRQQGIKQVLCHDHKVTWEERGNATLTVHIHKAHNTDGDEPTASFTCSMSIKNPIPILLSRTLNTKSPVVHTLTGRGISTGHIGFDSKWKLTSAQPEPVKRILSPENTGEFQAILNFHKSTFRIEIRNGELCLHSRTYLMNPQADAAHQLIQQTKAFRNEWEKAPDNKRH